MDGFIIIRVMHARDIDVRANVFLLVRLTSTRPRPL